MKKIVYLVTLASLLLQHCGDGRRSDWAVSVSEFEEKLKETPDETLLDVRTLREYQDGHLADAIMIDFHKTDFAEQLRKLDPSKAVFVYCAAGLRSEKAAVMLNDLGFEEIYTLDGGIHEWETAGNPIVKE